MCRYNNAVRCGEQGRAEGCGGAWNNDQQNARCAYRNNNNPDNRNNNLGLRVASAIDLTARPAVPQADRERAMPHVTSSGRCHIRESERGPILVGTCGLPYTQTGWPSLVAPRRAGSAMSTFGDPG
jgi:hypothetical protein